MRLIHHRNNFEIPVSSLVGSSYANFRKVARKHRFDRHYQVKYRLTQSFSWILDLFSRYDQRVYRNRVDAFQIERPPVFIIGFWRSGTTLLHSLLSTNPGFGYVTTFQAVFPNHTLVHQWWLKSLAKLLVKDFLSQEPETKQNDSLSNLTPREQEVLALLADGLNNPEIAEQLTISPKTVGRHRENIMRKLNLHSRTDLVKYAIRKGIIQA